ncbi:MAG: hypothetical protein ABW046_00155, partial [Actinoplanes sp.]
MTTDTTPNWTASWTQALPDMRADGETFTDVTLRSTLRTGIGGRQIRVQFDNRYGDRPLTIGRAAVTAGEQTVFATFDGSSGVV